MTDSETLDRAIGHLEPLLHQLYVFRRMVTDLGDLKVQFDHTKSTVAVTEQQVSQLAAELAANKAELQKVQEQEVEKRKAVAALTAELEQKQQTLNNYSAAIDRITKAA